MTETRPWRRALAWLAFLGPFFFASYGFANWLASRRSDVGAVAFDWERAIPFVAWTIVPYWSIDLLYVVSIFICTTRRELDRHAQRLLAVQLISIAFFIALPLRFSFDRPAADGVFGALFTALGSFDKPFNQAPSLHIGLLIVIWAVLVRHCAPRWRWALHAWMTLIGLSILTTYQHHFIDLPTGLAVGFAALWALPDDADSPLRRFALTSDPARRKLALRYAIGAAIFAALACLGGAWLWLLWPALALAVVSLNYAAFGAAGFQKDSRGRVSVGARGLLMPYLIGAWINSRLWTRRHPQPAEISDGVSIGRIPSAKELRASPFAAIVDLCAELSCGVDGQRLHRGFPVLDLTVPDASILRDAAAAVEEACQRGPVLVCCALGYSRSAAAIVAWLLITKRAATVDAAMAIVQKARPAIVLRREHCIALEAFA
ncbi:MAG: phosphatase PAP2/dual specificity phosphatase family protein [Acidobacteriota bacterium]|nr:phosphatase PAP2/dual specificity phosphatase family protein [Acidobacteriota bacterium]